jgi:hypothetical protein
MVTLRIEHEIHDYERWQEAFASFLHEQVWSAPSSSPALAGVAQTRILDLRRSERRD